MNYLLVAHTSEVTPAYKIALDPAHAFVLCWGILCLMKPQDTNQGHEVVIHLWDAGIFLNDILNSLFWDVKVI